MERSFREYQSRSEEEMAPKIAKAQSISLTCTIQCSEKLQALEMAAQRRHCNSSFGHLHQYRDFTARKKKHSQMQNRRKRTDKPSAN
jgi:hypothetical protein